MRPLYQKVGPTFLAFAEEGGADADVGGAFADGGLVVAGHAHGELAVGEGTAEVLEFAEAVKGMRVDEGGRSGSGDAHESFEVQAWE